MKIIEVIKCNWCGKEFEGREAFEAHRINGKTIDPKTNKPRRICNAQ